MLCFPGSACCRMCPTVVLHTSAIPQCSLVRRLCSPAAERHWHNSDYNKCILERTSIRINPFCKTFRHGHRWVGCFLFFPSRCFAWRQRVCTPSKAPHTPPQVRRNASQSHKTPYRSWDVDKSGSIHYLQAISGRTVSPRQLPTNFYERTAS